MSNITDDLEKEKNNLWQAKVHLSSLETIKPKIPWLSTVKKDLVKRQTDIDKKLKKIRKMCSHVFEYEGRTHNTTWYKCYKCGETQER
jgi:hypothetical protein